MILRISRRSALPATRRSRAAVLPAVQGREVAIAAETERVVDLDVFLDEAVDGLQRTRGLVDEMSRDLRRVNRKLAAGERRLERKIEGNWRLLRDLIGEAQTA